MMLILDRRALKRIKGRLAKKGWTFIDFVQNDPQLMTLRIRVEATRTHQRRDLFYPREWLKKASPRVIADSVVSDYVRGYGRAPA